MDNRSPRSRGILGPKPTSFKVRRDSNKIIKTPQSAPQLPPQPPQFHQQEQSQSRVPPRPLNTYIDSPKIITTNLRDFKRLVQRLTGMPSTSTDSSSFSTSSSAASDAPCGLISPAAGNASTEKADTLNELGRFVGGVGTMDENYNHHQYQQHQYYNDPIEQQSFDHAGTLSSGHTSLPLEFPPDFFFTVGPTEPQGEPLGLPPLPQPPQNHQQLPSMLWLLHRRSEPFRPQPPRNHPQEPSSMSWPLHRGNGPLGLPPLPQPPHNNQQEPSVLWPLHRRIEPLGLPPLPQPPHNHQQEPSILWPLHHRSEPLGLPPFLQSPHNHQQQPWFDEPFGLIPPEAQFASTEEANISNELGTFVGGVGTMDQQHQHHANGQSRFHHAGNLSARPSMPLTSPDFFPTVGPSELQDFSSFFSDDSNYGLPTSSSTIESPSAIEDFNDFFDF